MTMLADVPLRDVKPEVMACPRCKQRLMDIRDVHWAATKLEFVYGCSGCGEEVNLAVAQDMPAPQRPPERVVAAPLSPAPPIPAAPPVVAAAIPRPMTDVQPPRERLPLPAEKLFAADKPASPSVSRGTALLRDVKIFSL